MDFGNCGNCLRNAHLGKKHCAVCGTKVRHKGALQGVVTRRSRDWLLRRVPLTWPGNVFAHHVTVIFGVYKHDCLDMVGKHFVVDITEICQNEKIQALRLELPDELKNDVNRIPHLTLCADDGVKPKEANEMLEGLHGAQTMMGQLEVRLEFTPF